MDIARPNFALASVPHSMEPRPVQSWPAPRMARWALAILVLAYILSFIDRIVLSMLVGPIKADLHLSDTQFALIGGLAFSMFYATIGLPIGWLADRLPRRVIIAVGIALWSLFTAASGLSYGFGHLFVARMGVGVGEAALSPAAYSLIADYFRPERRGRAVAIYTLGVSLGSSLAYLIGGALIGFSAGHGSVTLPLLGATAPWRFVFIAIGLPGLLVALLVLTIREPARRTAPIGLIVANQKLFQLIRQHWRVTLAYVLGYSLINVPFAAFQTWGPALFSRSYHLTPPQLSWPLALIFLVPATLGQLFGATMTDRGYARGHRDAAFRTGAVCAFVLVPVAIAMPLMPNWQSSMAALALIVFLVCSSVGHHAVVTTLVAPNRLRGQYSAFFFLIQNVIGQAVATLIIALLTEHVFRDPASLGRSMAITGGLGATAGAITLMFGRSALRQTPAQG